MTWNNGEFVEKPGKENGDCPNPLPRRSPGKSPVLRHPPFASLEDMLFPFPVKGRGRGDGGEEVRTESRKGGGKEINLSESSHYSDGTEKPT
jgi:hypothetical protein